MNIAMQLFPAELFICFFSPTFKTVQLFFFSFDLLPISLCISRASQESVCVCVWVCSGLNLCLYINYLLSSMLVFVVDLLGILFAVNLLVAVIGLLIYSIIGCNWRPFFFFFCLLRFYRWLSRCALNAFHESWSVDSVTWKHCKFQFAAFCLHNSFAIENCRLSVAITPILFKLEPLFFSNLYFHIRSLPVPICNILV